MVGAPGRRGVSKMEDQPHAIQCIRNLPFFIAGPASFVPSRRCTLAAPLPYLVYG